jgi:erythromycin esterase-like protein
MNLGEKIIRYIQELPESKKAEVLDFVEYLRNRTEERNWSEFSLSSAMKGMENDDSIYSLKDIKRF